VTRIHLPDKGLRLACAICRAPTYQRHHIDYKAPEAWATIPLCDAHHEDLHRSWERVKDQGIQLAVFTARYIASPEGCRAMTVSQLSFADQATPEGEYWRWLEGEWDALYAEFGYLRDEAA